MGPWAQVCERPPVLQLPIDRAPHIDFQFIKINVAPFQSKKFTAAKSAACIEQHHHTKAAIKLRESQFLGFQAFGDSLPLGTLAHE